MKSLFSPLACCASAALLLASCKPSEPAKAPATPTPTPAAAAKPADPDSAAVPPAPAASPDAADAIALTLSDPVAIVDGEKIARSQLSEAFNEVVQTQGIPIAQLTDDQKLEGYRQILEGLITEKLVDKAAAGVSVTPADIEARIAEIKTRLKTEDAFQEWLAEVGDTPDKRNETLKMMLQRQRWLEGQIGDKDAVADEEVKKFYEANKEKFQQPETVEASHILFLVDPDAPEDVVAKKLEAAKQAAARAAKGDDFNALAKELSEEPAAKESGGSLGTFSEQEMIPEFSKAAFTQKIGEVGVPVRTQYGWHVIKVTAKKPAGMVPFDEVKEDIQNYLKNEKQEAAVQEILKSLHESAKIENLLPAPAPAAAPEPDASKAPEADKPAGN